MPARMYRAPVQDRARKTLVQIFSVTEELLRHRSFADLSLAEIARAAGVSTGAIFARVRDKDALLLALNEWLAEAIAAEAGQVLQPDLWRRRPLEASLVRLFETTIELNRRNAGVIRAVAERRDYPPLRESVTAANRVRLARIRECVDAARPRTPRKSVDLALLMCISVIRETVVFGDFWPEPRSGADPALARDLARAFLTLVGDAPARAQSRRP